VHLWHPAKVRFINVRNNNNNIFGLNRLNAHIGSSLCQVVV